MCTCDSGCAAASLRTPVDRNHRVLLAEVREHRAAAAARRSPRHAAAVVGRRAREARQAARPPPTRRAAPAVADDADLARRLRRVARRGDVDAAPASSRASAISALPALDVVGRVADVDAALHAVEQRRRDREVAVGGVAVGRRCGCGCSRRRSPGPRPARRAACPSARRAMPRSWRHRRRSGRSSVPWFRPLPVLATAYRRTIGEPALPRKCPFRAGIARTPPPTCGMVAARQRAAAAKRPLTRKPPCPPCPRPRWRRAAAGNPR